MMRRSARVSSPASCSLAAAQASVAEVAEAASGQTAAAAAAVAAEKEATGVVAIASDGGGVVELGGV